MVQNKKITIRMTLLIGVLLLALIISHVNYLALIMSDSDWIAYSFMRSFDRNHMVISGQIREYEAAESYMDLSGHVSADSVTVSFGSSYLELLKVTLDKSLNTIQVDSIMGSIEPITLDKLDLLGEEIKSFSGDEIKVVRIEKHKIFNQQVTDVYLLEDQIYLAIDYTGQIQKAWGEIKGLYTIEVSFSYD